MPGQIEQKKYKMVRKARTAENTKEDEIESKKVANEGLAAPDMN